MSSQTFRAQVAVGSWSGTPLMPDIDLKIPTEIIRTGKARTRGKIKIKRRCHP
jgi:hypothetical protein